MQKEIQKQVLMPLSYLGTTQDFSYGAAQAKLMEKGQFNKAARVMARRLEEMVDLLDLPFSRSELGSEAIFHNNGNCYSSLQQDSQQFFVMARNPIDGRELNEIVNGRKPRLNIVSGVCLFSTDAVTLYSDKQPYPLTKPGTVIHSYIDTLSIRPQLTFYELESIYRLSSFINALGKSNQIERVYLNIPRVEYYLYIMDAFQQGLVSANLALEWFEAVDQRHDRVFNLLKKHLYNSSVQVEDFQPLDPLKPVIYGEVAENNIPSVEQMQGVLKKDHPLWANLLRVDPPSSWVALNQLSYAYAYTALASEQADEKGDALTVAVESPTESKIFAYAKKLITELASRRRYGLVALYPHELLVPMGDNANKTMYHISAPSPKLSDVREMRRVYP